MAPFTPQAEGVDPFAPTSEGANPFDPFSINPFSKDAGWALLDEMGDSAVDFTSFVELDINAEGNALTHPVEEGGFASYNKSQSPLSVKVSLGIQGTEETLGEALTTLERYHLEAVKLTVVSPAKVYDSMTLKSFSYKRSREHNAGMLLVNLTLVEVREVQAQVTETEITVPKNPTSARNKKTGKTQTRKTRAPRSGKRRKV